MTTISISPEGNPQGIELLQNVISTTNLVRPSSVDNPVYQFGFYDVSYSFTNSIGACFEKVSSSMVYIVVSVQRATKFMNSLTLIFFQCIVLLLLYTGGKGVSNEWEYETFFDVLQHRIYWLFNFYLG